VKVHLVDGTYELFRHYFARPSHITRDGLEVAAARGVLDSLLSMIAEGATHLGVATDHVIESFRNDLWPGYKTGLGVPPPLFGQFVPLEEALSAFGFVVWPMVDLEADDALAAAARVASSDPRVEQVVICTPDKDLAQCVVDGRVVLLDRRNAKIADDAGVVERFGVMPESIPDYLALVGDSADGFPGLPGFGKRTASVLLRRYLHLEGIPADGADWDVAVRGAVGLAAVLVEQRELALLFRDLARLRSEADVLDSVDILRWVGPTSDAESFARRIDAARSLERARELAASR
jgi:5'-3' exonuclease